MTRVLAGLALVLALSGCASEAQRAERVLADFDAVSAVYGLSVDELRALPGVTVGGHPGTDPECFDTCSGASVSVEGDATTTGPTALASVLDRLGDPLPPPSDPSAPPAPPTPPRSCRPAPTSGPVSCYGRFEVDGVLFSASLDGTVGEGYSLRVER